MKNFSLPTPEEVGYTENPYLPEILEKIKSAIDCRDYSFRPMQYWPNIYSIEDEIFAKIHPFGWTISCERVGSKEDGYNTWVIKPLK